MRRSQRLLLWLTITSGATACPRRTPINRLTMAIHVLQGRPLAYRLILTGSLDLGHLSQVLENAWIVENTVHEKPFEPFSEAIYFSSN